MPFDNDQAKRYIRFTKVKQKVSGCFRTKAGAIAFIDILAYSSTVRRQGFSAFEVIFFALARDLIRDDEYSLKDIAKMLGFANHGYFSRMFQKRFGASPSQYQA